jgi:hypothetical protein
VITSKVSVVRYWVGWANEWTSPSDRKDGMNYRLTQSSVNIDYVKHIVINRRSYLDFPNKPNARASIALYRVFWWARSPVKKYILLEFPGTFLEDIPE